jgi:hypothetical protein
MEKWREREQKLRGEHSRCQPQHDTTDEGMCADCFSYLRQGCHGQAGQHNNHHQQPHLCFALALEAAAAVRAQMVVGCDDELVNENGAGAIGFR